MDKNGFIKFQIKDERTRRRLIVAVALSQESESRFINSCVRATLQTLDESGLIPPVDSDYFTKPKQMEAAAP
jgi:hypothetical protein